jgi:hypothetical protein
MRASNSSLGAWRSGWARPEAGVVTWPGIVPATNATRAGEQRRGIEEKAMWVGTGFGSGSG